MEKKEITTHAQLALQIMHLKAEKFKQENELKHAFKELLYTINPVSIVKGTLHELAGNNDMRSDLAKVSLNMGANFIIDMIFGRYRSIKGFVGSVLVEKYASKYINNNGLKIVSGISKLIRRKSKQEDNHK